MGNLRTSIILDLSGNLQQRARQLTGSLSQLGRTGSASMRLFGQGVAAAGRGLDRLGNRYTALLTGAAGIGAVRQVGNLEQRFTRLGIQANRSAEEMDALKKQIFQTAKAPDIRIDPGQITSAIEEIIEKTGDLDFAKANIRNIGLALQATGADGQAIGGILAEFQKMKLGAEQAFEALDILTVQGKEGAFTLQNLAALGPRVVTAYTSMGRTGVAALREMGAALQVIRQGTGSSEMAATAFEAVLRTLSDADKVKSLQKGGIRIFEPGSTTVMRSLPKIMEEIIQKTRGSKLALSKVFDAEAIRAFNAAAGEFQRTGKIESLQRFNKIQADGSTITRDSARAAKDFNAALTNLYTVWQQFADNQLAKPIKDLTDYMDGLKPGTVERWLEIGKAVALIGGGAIVARKVIGGGMGLYRAFGKKGAGAGVPGMGGMAGVVPVYVVNKQMSLLNDGSGFGGGAARSGDTARNVATKAGVMGIAAKALLPAAIAATAAAASTYAGQSRAEHDVSAASTSRLQQLLDRHTVMGGGPESYQARLISGELARRQDAQVSIKFENAPPMRVTQLKSSHGLDIDVDSGRMMVSH
jgi:hypothetical protein